MNSDLRQRIIEYIKEIHQVSVKEMVDYFGVPKQTLYWHLPKMLEKGELEKIGKPPKVYYRLAETKTAAGDSAVEDDIKQMIDDNYLFISSAGEKRYGWAGFMAWCAKSGNEPVKTAQEYIDTLNKYRQYQKNGLIDGLAKFKTAFGENCFLDEAYYLDFYAIERFGKTKLGQLLLYGKQSGNRALIKEVVALIKTKIHGLLAEKNIKAVGFVPWTVKREVQFMRELEGGLEIYLPRAAIEKVRTDIIVPQKTLNKLEDRIENAAQTMVVTEKGKYENVLLIDDAVGSGATLNEIAKQLKQKQAARKVIGLAITGSFKGFDVISEV